MTSLFTVKEKPRKPGRPKKLRDPNKVAKGYVSHREDRKRKHGQSILKKPPPPASCVDAGNYRKKPTSVCKQTSWYSPKNLENLKVTVETWDAKGADNFDIRNKNPLSKWSY